MRHTFRPWVVAGVLWVPLAVGADAPPKTATTVSGTVVDGQGKAVAGASVEILNTRQPVRGVSGADGSFRLVMPEPFRHGVGLLAKADKGTMAGYLVVRKKDNKLPDLRSLRLLIKPAGHVEVMVTGADGKPLAGAHAGALYDYKLIAQALTDANGHAKLTIPSDCQVSHLLAWQAGVGFDYRAFTKASFSDLGTPAPTLPKGAVALKLTGARTVRVKVVDGDHKPMANLPLYPWYLSKPGEAGDVNLSGAVNTFLGTTDAAGNATFAWVPLWAKNMTLWPMNEEFENKRAIWEAKGGAAEITLVLHRLEPLRGRVTFADGKPASGIRVYANGDGYDHDRFSEGTTTDAQGRYELWVSPNKLYLVVIEDAQWAAPAQGGFAVLPKRPTPPKDFVLRPATIIQGKVTQGKDRKPVPKQYLFLNLIGPGLLELPDVELPNPDNSRVAVRPTHGQTAVTDADGRFTFSVGPGKYQLHGPTQVKWQELLVTNQAKVEVAMHADRPETGQLTGRVVMGNPPAPVANALIEGIYRPYVPRANFTAKTRADGTFVGERYLFRTVLHARSADGQLAAVVEISPEDTKVTIPLQRVASAHGRLLDKETGKPLVGREFVYGINVPASEEPNSPFTTAFGGTTKTDAKGRFELKGMVPGQLYRVSLTLEGGHGWRELRKVVPAEGQVIDLGDLFYIPERPQTPADRRLAAFAAKGTPRERFEAACHDAKLGQLKVLLILARPDDPLSAKLYELLGDRQAMGNVRDEVRLLWVAAAGDPLPAALALAKQLQLTRPLGAEPVLVVSDAAGKVATERSVLDFVKDGQLAPERLRTFLQGFADQPLDARKVLADALARARKENKRLLLQETATWCGPCWLLARFLDRQRAVWEKDYLWVKMDHRWSHVEAVMKPIRGQANGSIPWTAILDGDGKVLATSNGPDGANIGFPTSAAGISHFETMLLSTALRLTPADIARLSKALQEEGRRAAAR